MLGKISQIGFLAILLIFQGCTRLPTQHVIDNVTPLFLKNNVPLEKISATLGPAGGELTNELGDTVVNVPANAMVTDTQLNILRKQDSYGTFVTTIEANQNTGLLQISLPESEFLSHILPNPVQLQQIHDQSLPVTPANTSYPLNHIWESRLAYFWKTHGGMGIGNRISGQIPYRPTQMPFFLTTLQTAVELSANCALADVDCYRGKEPILLIHGYTPSMTGLGGGESTWKKFPARLLELDTKYVVFEFRWVTAARFEEVAADLGQAIELIAKKTGKTVHLLGHSFGGLVIRTYLQGLAANFPYHGNIASVTTVGTPHSGILEEDKTLHNRVFRRGQDTQGLLDGKVQIGFCQQVSCYQAGHFVDFSDEELQIFKLNFADEFFNSALNENRPLQDVSDILDLKQRPGKFISLLSNLKTYPLPKHLPIQVLIGLTVKDPPKIQEGDGLISYAGQRFTPALTADKIAPLLKANTQYGGKVTEHLLGFAKDKHPGEDSALPSDSPDYWGYRHSDAPVGTLLKAQPMVQVDCDNVADCQHATFRAVRGWLQQHSSSAATIERTASVTLDVLDAQTNQPIPFAFVRIYKLRSSTDKLLSDTDSFVGIGQTDKQGSVTLDIELLPKATYYVRVNAWGFYPLTEANTLHVTKNDDTLHFGIVKLTPKPDRSRVSGVITAANSAEPLSKVSYYVRTGSMDWMGQSDVNGYYAITGLWPGTTSLSFMKDGYIIKQIELNHQPNQVSVHNVALVANQNHYAATSKSVLSTNDPQQVPINPSVTDDLLDFSKHSPQSSPVNLPETVRVKNNLETLF